MAISPLVRRLLPLDAKLMSHNWNEELATNEYVINFYDPDTNEFVAGLTTRTKRVELVDHHEYITRFQLRTILEKLTERGIISAPDRKNFRFGDPLPSGHPWRAPGYVPRPKTYRPESFRSRAKPVERNRLDLRIREDTRLRLNELIDASGNTATEIVEQAIRAFHLRALPSSSVPALSERNPDELPDDHEIPMITG